MEFPEKFEASKRDKDLGNTFFKAGRYRQALIKYKRALGFIEPPTKFTEEEKKQVSEHKLSLYLNLAAVRLKTLEYAEVLENTTKALGLDPNSVKALFRRAQARFHLSQLDEAKADLTHALQHRPQDKDLKQLLASVNQKLKAIHEKEKKAYSNLFGSD